MYLDKNEEPIAKERYCWFVVYNDDIKFYQFDDYQKRYHYFDEINQESVVEFGLSRDDGKKQFRLNVPEGARLIHFYDNVIQQTNDGQESHHRIYCFGYETADEEETLLSVLPNDTVVDGRVTDLSLL